MSINIKSREFPNVLTNAPASREGMNAAVSLRVDDAFALVDILDGVSEPQEVKKAQEIADALDLALDSTSSSSDKRNQKRYLKYLRELCNTFAILPSSFILGPTLSDHGAAPFATGGSSDVYGAVFNGRPVAVKTLKVTASADPEEVYRLLVKEVVGWKWLRHESILPFIGVTLAPPLFSIVSERMENGNIMDFIKTHSDHNRLCLLIDVVTGLEYVHGHDIIHGDLKGFNILIDSDCRARLADFGLAVVMDESTAGDTAGNRGMRGTIRWMAPEMMYPEKFGFVGEYRKRLPSRSVDIYALGMTILEVITGCPPFNYVPTELAVMCKVLGGGRPDRPSSGFSDRLWELLVSTWCTEHGSQPPKRPSTSAILNQLQEDVHNWGELIVPLTLVPPQNRLESADTASGQSEDDAFENTQVVSVVCPTYSPFPLPQGDPKKTSRRGPGSLGIAGKIRGLVLRFLSRLLGSWLASPSPS